MMPDVNGFDVVAALQDRVETRKIPILVVTAKQITSEDRDHLNGFVMAVVEKSAFDRERFSAEVQRAMTQRRVAV